jgi:hypothetical protein
MIIFWDKLNLDVHVAVLLFASLAFLVSLVAFIRHFRLSVKFAPKSDKFGRTEKWLVGVMIASASIVSAQSISLTTSPALAKRPSQMAQGSKTQSAQAALTEPAKTPQTSLRIQVPHRSFAGNPLPKVVCTQKMLITGHISNGFVVVEGHQVADKPGWFFVPVKRLNASTWKGLVYFGTDRSSNAGKMFNLEVFAMPEAWEQYLIGLEKSLYKKAGGGWGYSVLPPTYADVKRENVRRTNAKC